MSLKNKGHLGGYESDNPVMGIKSQEDAEALVRAFADEWETRRSFFLGAFERVTGEFVGQVYVGPVNWDLPEFTIGYFVDKDHEGQGYVTEAVKATLKFIFVHLKAWRVRLECDDTNVRSVRVAERCGFVNEGHLRQNKKNLDGTTSGTLWYAILREEFEA
jgi:RimJ/RimL family protein N-acetyltransferase